MLSICVFVFAFYNSVQFCIYFSFILCDCLVQVQRPQNSTLWTLQIKYPQLRDAGIYECQINSEPKISLSYTLNVIGEYLMCVCFFHLIHTTISSFTCHATATVNWLTFPHFRVNVRVLANLLYVNIFCVWQKRSVSIRFSVYSYNIVSKHQVTLKCRTSLS